MNATSTTTAAIRSARNVRAGGWRPRPNPDADADVPVHLRGRALRPDEVPHDLRAVAGVISDVLLLTRPWTRDVWNVGLLVARFHPAVDGGIPRLAVAAGVEPRDLKRALAIYTAYPNVTDDTGIFRLRPSTALVLLAVPEPPRAEFVGAAYDEGWTTSRTQWEVFTWQKDQREFRRMMSLQN